MKRRSFVKASLTVVAASAIVPATASIQRPKAGSEFYELRMYLLKDGIQQKLVENYYETAFIPAFNRLGIKNIGVFTELKPTSQSKLYVLIPYKNADDFFRMEERAGADTEYKVNAKAYLNAPSAAPAYERIQSSFMKAFEHMPKMEVPENKTRIFELRQYQSASIVAGKKKIEMFNDKGEIDIFKRLNFKPVFFGGTVIGANMPNLTYMVTFDDMDAHDAHWKSFIGDPQWKEISKVPEYADSLLVSKITPVFLVPTAFSQI